MCCGGGHRLGNQVDYPLNHCAAHANFSNLRPEIMDDKRNAIGRPTSYIPEYCDQVVEFMRAGFSLTAFAGHINVARSTINVWMEANPEFSEAVSRGKSARLLHWEEAAISIAKGNGGPGASTIVVFGLKNMAPEEYADTVKNELSGPNGGPIQTQVSARDLIASKLNGRAARGGTPKDTVEPNGSAS